MKMGHIFIKRINQWAFKFCRYSIFIDKVSCGQIKEKEVFSFDLDEGMHEIVIKSSFFTSNKIRLNLNEDETEYLECGCIIRGLKLMFSIFYVIGAIFCPSKKILYLKKVN